MQADHGSIAIGGVNIGGDLSGSFTVGYTADQVSLLLTQITAKYQPKPFDGRCPYKGLEVFEEEDAELFFGRERLVNDLISRVQESRAVFVTGPSGSGKSSLVRAGLIHALRQGTIKSLHSERWLYETMKPGREPLQELALAFSRLKSPELASYFQAHANEVNILNECAESVLSGRKDQRFVFFVDQFEEVFTQISQEEERLAFLNMLAHAGTVENGRVILLFAMRSDFVSNCATYLAINELLSQQFRQIGAMQPEELVSAIALPARHVGLPIEDELIARIINDMKGEPGVLPLMQFALKDLFDSQQEKGGVIALRLEDYLRHGGIQKSLKRHADASLAELNEKEQNLARSIFSGLIEIGRGTQDTRRTALFDELIPVNTNAEDVKAIVQKLADARLIITDEQAGKNTVTISHEKLIDAWPWLKKLVNENRDVIALQNEIVNDAKEWEDHHHDPSYLYSGARLVNANEQLKSNRLVLSGTAFEYIRAGQTRQRRGQIVLFGSITIIFALLITVVVIFANLTKEAQKQANIALARQLAAQAQSISATRNSKQMIAVLLATQSMKMFPSSESAQFLMNNNFAAHLIARLSHDVYTSSFAFSPDGKYIASGGCDNTDSQGFCTQGTARVWELTTGMEVARMVHGNSVSSVAFSSDGKYIVWSGCDNTDSQGFCTQATARVWEVMTGREVTRMVHDDSVNSAVFSPDGKYMISVSSYRTARIWDTATGKEVTRMTLGMVHSVAFSPDSKYVVSASAIINDNSARVWELTTGTEVARMVHDTSVYSVVFSPDGKYVASAGDTTARVWEAATGKEVTRMTHDSSVGSVAFSPDGKYVLSASYDNTARVWEATTGREVARMTHDSGVGSVALSPDGKYVASKSADKTIRVWEAITSKDFGRMVHDNSVYSVIFSPDGKYVASGSADHTVRVWEVMTGKEIARMVHGNWVSSVAFSQDGKYIVSGGCDEVSSDSDNFCIQGTARVWEVMTGKEISRITHEGSVSSVTFSPDGKYVVSEDWYHRARVWEMMTGKELAHMTDDWISPVAISPDGKYIVSGTYAASGNVINTTARVWEVMTGKEIARTVLSGSVHLVAFSSDGKYIVSVSDDDTARVWEAATGKQVAQVIHGSWVSSVAFSPDGKYVISGSNDSIARVWETATGKEVARMTHDGPVNSVTFSPDGKYVLSGSDDHTARVWEAVTGKEVIRKTHDGRVSSVAFRPDGKYIVSGSNDKTVSVWMWHAADLIANACAYLPRNLTPTEWAQYIGDTLPYQVICDNLPIEPEATPTPNAKLSPTLISNP